MTKTYTQHEGKVIETGGKFEHVMAITLDPRTNYTEGVARCITSRSGTLLVKGNIDRSKLYKIKGGSLEKFELTEPLFIKGEEEFIKELSKNGDFLGLEDPDIWVDPDTNLMHLYFTIPVKALVKGEKTRVHLGHAIGKDLDSLEMTEPALLSNTEFRAKEVSIAPLNSKGFRYNLVESKDRRPEQSYSTVQVAITKDMGKNWEYGDIAFHPAENKSAWIAGHASPGPLLPKTFTDVGENKLLGIINGCEADQKQPDGSIKYGDFKIGLFIYDYENGKIDWVSPNFIIEDTEAGKDGGRAITFASQFVETKPGEGILYAHVDDSFVRAYTLYAEGIKSLLP